MRDNWVLGGLLGGAAMFFWGAVSHMVLPVGEMGVRTAKPEAEAAMVAAMREALPEPALYLVPGTDPSQAMTPEAQDAWLARLAAGPTALVAWNPGPGTALGPRPLAIELLSNLAVCLIAAWVLTRLAPGTSYFRRVGVVVLFGLFAVLSVQVSYWAWYSFPGRYLAGQIVEQIVGCALAGVVVARHARPAAAQSPRA
jgi:hypothetical protein